MTASSIYFIAYALHGLLAVWMVVLAVTDKRMKRRK